MAQRCVVLQGPKGQQLVVDDVHLIDDATGDVLCTVQPGSKDDTIFLSMMTGLQLPAISLCTPHHRLHSAHRDPSQPRRPLDACGGPVQLWRGACT